MSIDGPGIIDSDLAHDIYSEFMDLYDAGSDVSEIRKKIYDWKPELSDALELEIFLSVLCQALWEIGKLNENDFLELEQIIKSEKGLKIWQTIGDDLYTARKRTLTRQLSKLSKPRSKPRKRKKYKKVESYHFQVGDCLSYMHSNEHFYALIIYSIDQYRGECLYSMVVVDNDTSRLPIIDDFTKGQFVGRKIPTTLKREGFDYGFSVVRPEHRELLKYLDRFQIIGNINLRFDNNCIGSFGGVLTQKDFEDDIIRIKEDLKTFGNKLFDMGVVLTNKTWISRVKNAITTASSRR